MFPVFWCVGGKESRETRNLKAGMSVRGDGMSRKHDMFVILHCRWVGGGSASSGTCIGLCLNVCTCCLRVKCKCKSLAWGRENRVRAGKTEKSDAHADAAATSVDQRFK